MSSRSSIAKNTAERERPTPRDNEKQETYLERETCFNELLEQCRTKAEVIVAKQRHGPIGTVTLQFNGDFTQFADLKADTYLPEERF